MGRGLLCALVLVLACTAAASATGDRTMVIRLKSLTVRIVPTDLPPKGLSKGDSYQGRFRLLNVVPQFGRKAGAAVGEEDEKLTLTSADTAVVVGTVTLPGGTLVYRGGGRIGSSVPIPVVRGTGRFAGARGTLTVGGGTSPLNTYRLTLP